MHFSNVFFDSMFVTVWCQQHFLYTFKKRADIIAPGLSITAVIEYLARDEEEKSDILSATVDGCPIEIPVRS